MYAAAVAALALAFPVDLRAFKVLERDSGPVSYYKLIRDREQEMVRGIYRPPLRTVTLFAEVPDSHRRGVRKIRWRWRALALPRHGNECADGLGDSAAAVYVTWKRGLRWYSLKFIWSTEAPEGATCNRTRNPLVASDSVVLRSGGPVNVWREEEIDPEALFVQHFGGEVPELQGLGLMSDGDQTNSVSAADYSDFVLLK
jgi:hypothetical protein